MWRRRPIPNNYALTNLDPAVVAAADKSLSRGGTETIVYSNATPGVYYIGVKSEDQQAAEYALLGVFSQQPFGTSNPNGDLTLFGFPVPAPIPDASVNASGIIIAGQATIMCIAAQPITAAPGDRHQQHHPRIDGRFAGHPDSFGPIRVVLNNHSPNSAVVNQTYIYDDSAGTQCPLRSAYRRPGQPDQFRQHGRPRPVDASQGG